MCIVKPVATLVRANLSLSACFQTCFLDMLCVCVFVFLSFYNQNLLVSINITLIFTFRVAVYRLLMYCLP